MEVAVLINIIIVVTVAALALLVGVLIFQKLRENETLKYEFITIIAHKFRTPLTQIKWTTEGLLADEQDAYKKQSLSDIHGSNENLIKLTTTLVELTDASQTSKSNYKMERLNLCDLSQAAMEASKNLFHAKNLFISVSCSEPEIYVNVDLARIEFVLGTIFDNACSYTPPGRNISVTVNADKQRATLNITDDGIGIDPSDMSRIFSKFYRTKQAQAMDTEGLGVALYLCKSVMKRHGGKIEASSMGLGKGSTFSVVLPRVK